MGGTRAVALQGESRLRCKNGVCWGAGGTVVVHVSLTTVTRV